jgi:hypothetical protein
MESERRQVHACPYIQIYKFVCTPSGPSNLPQHPRDTPDAVTARQLAWAEHAEDVADFFPGLQRLSAQGDVPRVFELIEGVVVRPRKKEPVA